MITKTARTSRCHKKNSIKDTMEFHSAVSMTLRSLIPSFFKFKNHLLVLMTLDVNENMGFFHMLIPVSWRNKDQMQKYVLQHMNKEPPR